VAILPLAALAARPRGLPIVLTVHCSPTHTLRAHDGRTALVRGLGGWLERRTERRAAMTLVYTDRLADRLARMPRCGPVQVMRRGIDAAAFAAPESGAFPERPGRPRVVFLGRVVRAKGVDTLVEAAARLRTPGADVVIVGDGPDRTRIEALARGLGVADRVHVTGFVGHERVPSILASADLLVLPSRYEELGTVLVEAMHAGLPVVATRVGGIPEVVADGVTGLLVASADPSALAAAIDAVLSDPALAGRMRESARRRALLYDLEHVGAAVHALYERLGAAPVALRPSDRFARAVWATT